MPVFRPWSFLCWCQVQPVSGDVVGFLWMGQTWSFRSALDAADIRGAYYETSTEGEQASSSRQYYRTIQIDLGGGEKGRIREVISEVFHNLAMRVIGNRQTYPILAQ